MCIRIRRYSLRWILLVLLGSTFLLSFGLPQMIFAQSAPGIQMFSTNENGVDLATGNINIDNIQFRSKSGKIPFWSHLSGTSGMDSVNQTWNPMFLSPGITLQTPATAIRQLVLNVWESVPCYIGNTPYTTEHTHSTGTLIDQTGASHTVSVSSFVLGSGPAGSTCGSSGTGGGLATDGSGYSFVVTNGNLTVYDRSGNQWGGLCTYGGGCSIISKITDPDGATIFLQLESNGTYEEIDSLNTEVFTLIGGISSAFPLSYLDVNNNTQQFTFGTTPTYIATNFKCSGGSDYTGADPFNMLTSITTPTGAKYGFAYEPTPDPGSDLNLQQEVTYYTGRIATVTLPSGGSINYAYFDGNNGINCYESTVPNLQVTVNDNNGNSGLYTYASSLSTTGSGGAGTEFSNFTVTKTDAANNQTVYTFSGEFQTQAMVYTGGCPKTMTTACTGGGTLLSTTLTCYNQNYNSAAACIAPASIQQLPITQTDVYTSLNGGTYSLVETIYDTYGDVTDVKNYDYGAVFPPSSSATPLSEVQTTYNTGSSCGTVSIYTRNLPCTITTLRSGSMASKVNYTYTSGHPTQTTTWVSGSNNTLTSTATYSNGVIASSIDANLAKTTFSYANSCNDYLVTKVSYSVDSLFTSQTWNCNGGVLETSTDISGAQTTYGYVSQGQNGTADPLWRLLSSTDALGYTTWTTYSLGGTLPVTVETTLANTSTSAVDSLTTYDGLMRSIITQKRTTPGLSSFDNTIVTTYDKAGRAVSESLPCASTASTPCSSPVLTKTTYDGLNRPLTVTDAGTGYAKYSYLNNDVLQTTGPAPNGENTKTRQMQYDGVGRLTSVCEVTAGTTNWPGGACGNVQTNAQTGYLTIYSYSGPGTVSTLTGVTQNALGTSQQTRTYTYDGLGRLTSESNPETTSSSYTTNTTYYIYDSDAAGTCPGPYSGDLVKRVDNMGNVTCFAYDGIHRKTGVTYPAGYPYSYPITPNKCFLYDALPIDGNTVNYPTGHLAEAYTTASACSSTKLPTVITDEAFGYSQRGDLSDVYESTPDSGSYYHTTATYRPSGVLNVLSGVPSHNAWTFGVDGEGRLNSAIDGTSTTLVTSATYTAGSQPNVVSLGSGDSDTYTYDPNTGRMSEYDFTIGTTPKNLTGSLNWNPNWSLGSLVIVDPFTVGDNQTCDYSADDLARLASVTCGPTSPPSGAIWGQSFSYDPFGNITKSVPQSMMGTSFAASYLLTNGTTNNQEQSVSSCVPTYDGNGNLTSDCTSSNTYTWDSDGNMVSVNGIAITYDAFDRAVENDNSGTDTEILYSPIGKLALMAKQIANKVFLPLPGGEQAVYTNSTINFRHADWLGSARAESDLTPPLMGDVAYAPFGETYAANDSPSTSLSFTGANQDTIPGTYDFLYRRYNPVQGRWISPDPSGLGAVDPTNPQSWNRYAYVLNNPLSYRDPLGLDCAYLNDSGDGVESVDQSSNSGECGSNGGYWVDGGLTDYQINSQSGSVQLWGTNTGMDQNGNQSYTYAQYQDTTLNVGWFMNTGWNPFGHIGIGIGNNPFVGLNPASDMQFLGSLTGHLFGCVGRAGCNALANTTVPGVISPENPNQSPLQNVSIPITGMQANMIQSAINGSTVYPPNYSVMGPQPACDCGTWAQQMLLAGGLQSGIPAPVPAYLIEQLNQIYNPW